MSSPSSRSSSRCPGKEPFIPTLCLVGCSKTKLRRAAPARELYCSALFRLCRRWAEQHADAWAILSAHHGLVEPHEVIEPYDTTVAQRRPYGGPPLSPKEFGFWLYAQVQAWRSRYAMPPRAPRLIVLAGRDYWRWLVEHRLEIHVPLDGLGIGERLRWLKQQTGPRPEIGHRPEQPTLFPLETDT